MIKYRFIQTYWGLEIMFQSLSTFALVEIIKKEVTNFYIIGSNLIFSSLEII